MVMLGSWMRALRPATTSRRLWGGILVAMPTAIPAAPLTNRCGTLAGSTAGSSWSQEGRSMSSTVCGMTDAWCWLRPDSHAYCTSRDIHTTMYGTLSIHATVDSSLDSLWCGMVIPVRHRNWGQNLLCQHPSLPGTWPRRSVAGGTPCIAWQLQGHCQLTQNCRDHLSAPTSLLCKLCLPP